jgi:hypothetical protein
MLFDVQGKVIASQFQISQKVIKVDDLSARIDAMTSIRDIVSSYQGPSGNAPYSISLAREESGSKNNLYI